MKRVIFPLHFVDQTLDFEEIVAIKTSIVILGLVPPVALALGVAFPEIALLDSETKDSVISGIQTTPTINASSRN